MDNDQPPQGARWTGPNWTPHGALERLAPLIAENEELYLSLQTAQARIVFLESELAALNARWQKLSSVEVRLPDVGADRSSGALIFRGWLDERGNLSTTPHRTYGANESVYLIECDKASMEIEARFGCTITETCITPGQEVKQGDLIGRMRPHIPNIDVD